MIVPLCAVPSPVAGQTSEFVNKILENTSRGDPTGGLVGLRVPTSKNQTNSRPGREADREFSTLLSHCNYALLCMPLQPRLHTQCMTHKHTPILMCMSERLFSPCTCTARPSFQALHAETEHHHHHLPSHGGHLSGEVHQKASDGCVDEDCCALKTTGDECLTCVGGRRRT